MIMSIYFFLFTEHSKNLFEKTHPHKIDSVKKPRPQKAQPSKTSFNPLENIMQAQEKLLDNPKHHKGMMVSHLLIITCLYCMLERLPYLGLYNAQDFAQIL